MIRSIYCKWALAVCLGLFSLSAFTDVYKDYERYTLKVAGINIWNSDKVYCAPASKQHRSKYPNANYIFDIVSADNIVVFAHGFLPHKNVGELSLREMADNWKYHIDLLSEVSGKTSYCVVTWDTEYGFDDKSFTLTRLMLLFDKAARDTRLDSKVKTVSYVGHSAGGNYIKFSHVEHLRYYKYYEADIKKNHSSVVSNAKKGLKRHIVTLATPHLGAKLADTGEMTTLFGSYLLGTIFGDDAALLGQKYHYKAKTRGALQLRTIEGGNQTLYELNRQFAKTFPASEIFAIAGKTDSTVDISSANPYFASNYSLNFEHDTFLHPYRNASLMRFLTSVYQGHHPKVKKQ